MIKQYSAYVVQYIGQRERKSYFYTGTRPHPRSRGVALFGVNGPSELDCRLTAEEHLRERFPGLHVHRIHCDKPGDCERY